LSGYCSRRVSMKSCSMFRAISASGQLRRAQERLAGGGGKINRYQYWRRGFYSRV
jgi:hypothetical protein